MLSKKLLIDLNVEEWNLDGVAFHSGTMAYKQVCRQEV
jgi:hypothetical protein